MAANRLAGALALLLAVACHQFDDDGQRNDDDLRGQVEETFVNVTSCTKHHVPLTECTHSTSSQLSIVRYRFYMYRARVHHN